MAIKTDHDLIVEMHTALKGFNGEGGLVEKVDELERLMKGDPNAIDNMLKLGVIGVLQTQQTERRNIMRFIKGITGIVATIIAWIVAQKVFHP